MTPLTQGCIHKLFQTLDLETGRFIVHGLRAVLFSTLNSSNKRPALPSRTLRSGRLFCKSGGNYITESGCTLELVRKLEDLAGWLKIEYNIPVISICDIFSRPIPRDVSPVTYESKRCDTMQYLNNLIDVCPEIPFWKHRQMFNCPNNIFLSDRVHLNYTGMNFFYETLKLAVILATELD